MRLNVVKQALTDVRFRHTRAERGQTPVWHHKRPVLRNWFAEGPQRSDAHELRHLVDCSIWRSQLAVHEPVVKISKADVAAVIFETLKPTVS